MIVLSQGHFQYAPPLYVPLPRTMPNCFASIVICLIVGILFFILKSPEGLVIYIASTDSICHIKAKARKLASANDL